MDTAYEVAERMFRYSEAVADEVVAVAWSP